MPANNHLQQKFTKQMIDLARINIYNIQRALTHWKKRQKAQEKNQRIWICSSEEQIQRAHKYIKSNTPVLIKMQTKLTLTYCIIPSRLTNT